MKLLQDVYATICECVALLQHQKLTLINSQIQIKCCRLIATLAYLMRYNAASALAPKISFYNVGQGFYNVVQELYKMVPKI